jgi:hypothetical protein
VSPGDRTRSAVQGAHPGPGAGVPSRSERWRSWPLSRVARNGPERPGAARSGPERPGAAKTRQERTRAAKKRAARRCLERPCANPTIAAACAPALEPGSLPPRGLGLPKGRCAFGPKSTCTGPSLRSPRQGGANPPAHKAGPVVQRLVKPNPTRRLPSPCPRINGIGPVVSAMHLGRWDLRRCTIGFCELTSHVLGRGAELLIRGVCHRGPLSSRVEKTTLAPLWKLG